MFKILLRITSFIEQMKVTMMEITASNIHIRSKKQQESRNQIKARKMKTLILNQNPCPVVIFNHIFSLLHVQRESNQKQKQIKKEKEAAKSSIVQWK